MSAIDGGCLTLKHNLPLRPQRHPYGLDHPHHVTTTTAGWRRAQFCASACYISAGDAHPKRHFAPGDVQFLTSSTYPPAMLFESDRLRLISVLSGGRRAALCAIVGGAMSALPARLSLAGAAQLQAYVQNQKRGMKYLPDIPMLQP
jgi:hypothetical protein